jgi:uncharacterized protein (TIRG00374 family)
MEEIEAQSLEGGLRQHKRMWLYVLIAVGMSVAAIVLLSLFTMDHNTFKAISHVEIFSLIMVTVLVIGRWVTETLRYTYIIKAVGRKLSFGKTAKSILGAAFTGAVTPYRSASFPTQVFFLTRYGLTGGEATAVSLTGGAISLLVMTVAMPIVLVLSLSKMHVSLGMSTVIVCVAVIAFFAFMVAVYSMRDPSRFTRIVRRLTPGFLKRKPKYERFEERLAKGMEDFSRSLHTLLKARKRLLIAIVLLTIVFWLAGAFVASWILRGLGYPQYFWKAMLGQMLVTSILPFTPVPGESGVAEVAFAGVFSIFIAKNTLALVTVTWRFFMLYLPLIGLGIAFVLAANDARRIGVERAREEAVLPVETPALPVEPAVEPVAD